VYAVSVDPPEKLSGFQEKLGDSVTLLSDPDAKAIEAWDMLDHGPFPKRTMARAGSFLIGTDGRVRFRWLPDYYRERPTPDQILATLK
jgi:peroxiredoxin